MSNTVTLEEPQVNALMATYVGIQLERAHAPTGPFSLLVQLPYVLNQTLYTYLDVGGVVTDWYRTARYTSGGLGPYSPAWPVQSRPAWLQPEPVSPPTRGRGRLQHHHPGHGHLALDQPAGRRRLSEHRARGQLSRAIPGNTSRPASTRVRVRRVVYGGLQTGLGVVTVERPHTNLTPQGAPGRVLRQVAASPPRGSSRSERHRQQGAGRVLDDSEAARYRRSRTSVCTPSAASRRGWWPRTRSWRSTTAPPTAIRTSTTC